MRPYIQGTICLTSPPFLPVFVCLLLLLLPSLTSSTSTSGPNSTLTFPPLSPATLWGNATLRTVFIQARTSAGAAVVVGGDLFTAHLLTSSPSCSTNVTYPLCLFTCSPLIFPNAPSPFCTSSPVLPSSAFPPSPPNYVPISVTDLGTGLYSLTYLPSYPDTYSLAVSLLTQGGLQGLYYDNVWFLPPVTQSRIDPTVSFNWSTGAITPTAVDYVSVRWTGKLRPSTTENYTIYTTADDWVRVWVDRRLIINAWGGGCCNETWGTVSLAVNQSHDLIVDYAELRGSASISLSWRSPSIPKQIIPTTALYYRAPISGSPFPSIVIGPGDSSALTSVAYDSDPVLLGVGKTGGLSAAVAGVNQSVLLRAVDAFGNVNTNATTNTSLITCTLTGADPLASTSIAWLNAGIYVINYTAAVTGNYSLSIKVKGFNVAGSPFTVTIAPAPTSPTSSTLYAVPTTAIAGVTSVFWLQLKDALGNNRTSTSVTADTLYVTWVNTATVVSYQAITSASSSVPGLLFSSFTPTLAGSYTLTIILDAVTLSTTTVPVTSGVLSPSASTAFGLGLTSAIAGIPANISVIARDQFGNRLTTSASAFVFSVAGIGGALAGSNGQYNASYILNATGTYSLSITSAGIAVQGSPFSVVAYAGSASSSFSFIIPPVLTSAVSGTLTTFQIQSRDAVGNPLTQGGVVYTASLQCSNTVTAGTVTDLGTGVYNVSLTPTTAATVAPYCWLYVLGGGVNISGSAFSLIVRPGPATGASVSSGTGRTFGTAGLQSTIGLTAIDGAGNTLISGGSAIAISVTPAASNPSLPAPHPRHLRLQQRGIQLHLHPNGRRLLCHFPLSPCPRGFTRLLLQGHCPHFPLSDEGRRHPHFHLVDHTAHLWHGCGVLQCGVGWIRHSALHWGVHLVRPVHR